MAPLKWILASLSLFAKTQAVRLLASHFSGTIYTLDLEIANNTSATLTQVSKDAHCGVTPTWLYLDQDNRIVYCFDESWAGSGVVTQYSLGVSANSAYNMTGQAKTPGNSVYGSSYGGADGKKFLITAEYSPSTITTYKLPITSSTKALETLEFTMAKPGPRPDRQDRPHPHSAFTDPSGQFIIVPDLGADLVRIFKFDNDTGKLTACPSASSLAGDGPRHGVFQRFGNIYKYYSLNEVSSSVGVYDVVQPTTTGGCLSLNLTQTLSNYGPNVPIGNVTVKSAEIRLVGDYLYASNRNDTTFGKEQDSIAVFKVGTGTLKFVGLSNSYSYYPRSFAFNKAGTYVAIGGQTTANVAILPRDPTTGLLGKPVANLVLPPRGTYGGEDGLSSIVWDE